MILDISLWPGYFQSISGLVCVRWFFLNENFKLSEFNKRIIEYPKSEWTHKDHWLQVLAPHRTIQNSNQMSESVVQTLLELQQVQRHDHFPGETVPVHNHPFGENPFPDTQCDIKQYQWEQQQTFEMALYQTVAVVLQGTSITSEFPRRF